jgi:hypothetical protein
MRLVLGVPFGLCIPISNRAPHVAATAALFCAPSPETASIRKSLDRERIFAILRLTQGGALAGRERCITPDAKSKDSG